jgi:hypothetical protein
MNGRGGALLGALAALAALLAPAVASAQDYDTSVAWGGGYYRFAPLVDGDTAAADLGFGGTWVAVLQAETWQLNRWVGARLGGFYSMGSIDYPIGGRDHAIYGLEAAALVRVVPPAEDRSMTAYLIAGGGLTWFSMGETSAQVPGTTVVYDADESRQLVALGGLGIEVLTGLRAFGGDIGVRLEGIDNVHFDRPLRPIGEDGSDMTHNLRFTVALFSGVPKLF